MNKEEFEKKYLSQENPKSILPLGAPQEKEKISTVNSVRKDLNMEDVAKHNHYFKDVSKYKQIDVYRALEIFGVIHPAQQHLAKKALCAGNRGYKDLLHDIQDIIDTAERWKQMIIEENENK